MCGITGIAFRDRARLADAEVLRRMTATLQHRGPDGEGLYLHPGIALGVRRLSIIDLETGDQPISNEDGSVTVVCNGEIYNFLELRGALEHAGHRFATRSDVEVIVHLYEQYGTRFVEHLRGMFGLALWDGNARALVLARDRLGIKPMHYALNRDAIYFGSEQKAILASDAVPRDPDMETLKQLFTLGFIVAPRTMFAEIRQLPPGCTLVYRNGSAAIQSYWEPQFPRRGEEDHSRSEAAWAQRLLEKLDETVRLHLRSDVPVGAWLSGGLDSSAITALMSRIAKPPVRAFSLAFSNPQFDEFHDRRTLKDFPDYDLEVRTPLCTTQDFGAYAMALWHGEDPTLGGIEIPRLVLSRETGREFKVVLTGEGSDEIFGGYPWFRVDKLLRPLTALPRFARRAFLFGGLLKRRSPRASRILLADRRMTLRRYRDVLVDPNARVVTGLFSHRLATLLEPIDPLAWELARPREFDRWHPLAQMQYYEMRVRLPSFITHTLDRQSMACSLEARVPFLDHELVELVAEIPPSLKMKWLREKHILREACRPILPTEIIDRRKKGLAAPIIDWLRDDPPGFAVDVLSEARLKEKGYFDPAAVKSLWDRHRADPRDWGSELLGVLAVQLWDELFVRGRTPSAE